MECSGISGHHKHPFCIGSVGCSYSPGRNPGAAQRHAVTSRRNPDTGGITDAGYFCATHNDNRWCAPPHYARRQTASGRDLSGLHRYFAHCINT
ncbi:MAG: hypothetical protein [Caudoviricetes sp.]|nr:MAG: hypothetical protein [Caudoviricetes sp.]